MYLGVDGGGTKTAFILINKNGKILAQLEQQSAYYLETGLEQLRSQILIGIKAIFQKSKVLPEELDYAFFGFPAYGEDSKVIDFIDNIPSELIPKQKYRCGNDMVSGWASAFGCQDGINIVAGTGSIAYGEYNNLKARCGGWGELFSDEGSAYWLAIQGLAAFTRMSDGRKKKTLLYDLMKKHFSVKNDLDVCATVLNDWQGARSKIAALSKVVYQSAVEGDETSLSIFYEGAGELALLIESTRNQLNLNDDVINVSYSGGVFNGGDLIVNMLKRALLRINSSFSLQPPKYIPVIGSALYAAKIDGFDLTQEAQLALALNPSINL